VNVGKVEPLRKLPTKNGEQYGGHRHADDRREQKRFTARTKIEPFEQRIDERRLLQALLNAGEASEEPRKTERGTATPSATGKNGRSNSGKKARE